MALTLSSASIKEAISKPGLLMPAIAAGSALGSTMVLRQLKPGGWKTLAGLGALGGGAYFTFFGKGSFLKCVGIGAAASGAWSLISK